VGFGLGQSMVKRQTVAANIYANKLAQCLLFLISLFAIFRGIVDATAGAALDIPRGYTT
jgi:hypothetical protein